MVVVVVQARPPAAASACGRACRRRSWGELTSVGPQIDYALEELKKFDAVHEVEPLLVLPASTLVVQ